MNAFTVSSRDLSGPGNPGNSWSVSYLRLKKLLDAHAPPGQLRAALFALALHNVPVPRHRITAALQLSPEEAFREVVRLIHSGFVRKGKGGTTEISMPADWQPVVRKLIHRMARRELALAGREYRQRQQQLEPYIQQQAESAARQLIEEVSHSVVHVVEDGTADAFQALYIDGKLVVTNPRSDVGQVLQALGIEPQVMLVAHGFDGNFPEKLARLKTYKPK
jgi:hypothetical protein